VAVYGASGGWRATLRRSSHRATGWNSKKVWPKQWVKQSFSAVAATTERSPPAPARGSAKASERIFRKLLSFSALNHVSELVLECYRPHFALQLFAEMLWLEASCSDVAFFKKPLREKLA